MRARMVRVVNYKIKNRVDVRFITKVFRSVLPKVRKWQLLLEALPWLWITRVDDSKHPENEARRVRTW